MHANGEEFFRSLESRSIAYRPGFWFGGVFGDVFMDERLNNLEMLYSDQSRMLEDLSAEMYQQQQEIKRLTARIERLEEKLAAVSNSNDIGGHERPPHY